MSAPRLRPLPEEGRVGRASGTPQRRWAWGTRKLAAAASTCTTGLQPQEMGVPSWVRETAGGEWSQRAGQLCKVPCGQEAHTITWLR